MAKPKRNGKARGSSPRRRHPAKSASAARPAQIGANGMPADVIKNAVDEIEAALERKAQKHMEYMNFSSRIAGAISAVYDAAKEKGVPKKELKAVIKARGLERKIEKLREDLEDDQQGNFDAIRFALGDLADLPLGQSAIAREAAAEGVDELASEQ